MGPRCATAENEAFYTSIRCDAGPDHGCNGAVSDYTSIWWGCAAEDAKLNRFPEPRRRLEHMLKRFVGHTHSPLPRPQTGRAEHPD